MKKVRNHFLVLFGLLLLGILTLSVGTSAKAFQLLNLSSPTGSQSVSDSSSNNGKQSNAEDIGNLQITPISSSSTISHSDESSGTGDEEDSKNEGDSAVVSSIQTIQPMKVTASSLNAEKPSSTSSSSDVTSSDSSSESSSDSTGSAPSSGDADSSQESGDTSSDTEKDSPSDNSGNSSNRRTVAITGVTLDKPTLYFPTAGKTSALTATVSPANTTQSKNITWSSADDTIAAVDKSGKVTAIKGGRTKITAKTANGKTDVCSVTVRIPATKVTLLNNEPDIEIEKGSSLALSATLEPADTTDVIKWTTSDSNILAVDSAGKITAVNAGTATITAAAGDVSAEFKATVGISITKIELSDTDITLNKGDTKAITATIVPPDTTEDKAITWSSSNDKVLTVDTSGNITAVGGGSAVITVQAGKHISQCNVTVVVPLTGMEFEQGTFKLTKGKPEKLPLVFTPSDATDKALTWGSSDPSIATVDGTTGAVTGVSVGTATITAISHDGGFVAQCTVNVVVPVTGISLDKTSLPLIKGKSDTLTATITPEDATDKALTWASSDTSVAAVDANGKVTATGGGSAVITVTTHDGGFTAKCDVTVTVPVTGIKLSSSSLSLAKNKSSTLTATITPEDATDKAITWTSSDTSVATVDENGKVTATGRGSAVITVSTNDGGFTAKCDVTVSSIKAIIDNSDCGAFKGKINSNGSGALTIGSTYSGTHTFYDRITFKFSEPISFNYGDEILRIKDYQYTQGPHQSQPASRKISISSEQLYTISYLDCWTGSCWGYKDQEYDLQKEPDLVFLAQKTGTISEFTITLKAEFWDSEDNDGYDCYAWNCGDLYIMGNRVTYLEVS